MCAGSPELSYMRGTNDVVTGDSGKRGVAGGGFSCG